MGYYTRYSLSWDDYGLEAETELAENIGYNPFDGEIKWYDHEKDMRTLSKKYPTVLFDLYGEGEEYPDVWHKYFKNGKMQYCKLIEHFDDFDEEKLC